MHGYCGDIAHGIHIPNLPEQLLLGEYVVRVLRQEGQQIKLPGSEVLLLSVHPHPAGGLVAVSYTPLTLSRIISCYTIRQLPGSDIRIKKKLYNNS